LFSDLSSQVDVLALNEGQFLGREDLAQAEVNILKKTLRGCLQEENLVVMVLMVG
jgi:hypothetical protein